MPRPGLYVDPATIGGQLRAARERKGLRLSDLAEACGLSLTALSVIERGVQSPTWEQVEMIGAALGLRAKLVRASRA